MCIPALLSIRRKRTTPCTTHSPSDQREYRRKDGRVYIKCMACKRDRYHDMEAKQIALSIAAELDAARALQELRDWLAAHPLPKWY